MFITGRAIMKPQVGWGMEELAMESLSIGLFWNDWSRIVGSLAAKLPSYGKGNVYDTHCHHEDRCHAMQRKQKKNVRQLDLTLKQQRSKDLHLCA